MKNVRWQLMLISLIIVIYFVCLFFYTHQLMIILNQEKVPSIDEKNKDAFEFLRKALLDDYGCYHCINIHTTYSQISDIVRVYDMSIKYQRRFTLFRLALNGFGIFNVITTSSVFGGPLLINIISSFSCVCLVLAQLVQEICALIILESMVVVVSTMMMIHSCYSIFVNILEIHSIRLLKRE